MTELTADFVIFDLDGVLIDSSVVVERHWRQWAAEHDLDGDHLMSVVHGRRTVDTIRTVTPHLDAEQEAHRLAEEEGADTDGLKRIEGAKELVEALPEQRWAIATSGTRSMAETRVRYARLPFPSVFITAEDVENGKPDPEVYLIAARRLEIDPTRCIVFEDSPPGIDSARAAGMQTIAVTTTHEWDEVEAADVVAGTLRNVEAAVKDGQLLLRVQPQRNE